MKIQAVGLNSKLAFKSIRTDKNTVEQLKNGKKPIIENNKINIYAALNNLSTQTDRESIEFLLDVADNLAYGQGATKDVLDKDGTSPSERENTDWSALLQDTINKALSASSDDVSDLKSEYKRIFGKDKELTSEQEKLLALRNSLTSAILSSSNLEEPEDITMTARVRKNLDYFVASSEIPLTQKQECIEKLTYFMSDDYKITPQLQDKKLQVLDEVLNDMIIKTPEDDVMTIKTVNQRQTGMCAAISICRKNMAYEDKTRYVELIMDELSDSPVMSVYDITDLESGNKVNIPKTSVDYDAALSHGYRIIDTAAHLWMHNAHASGDGSIQTEHYIPFDDDNYGVYNDSSWYLGLDENLASEKALLMALIKENEFISSYSKTRKSMDEVQRNVSSVKKDVYNSQTEANGKLNAVFSIIFPEKSTTQKSHLIADLIKFYEGSAENNEVNVPSKLPKELKQEILTEHIIDLNPDMTEVQKSKLKDNAKIIFDMTSEYASANAKLKSLKRFKTPRSKFAMNKKLYNIAAAHRLAIEADVNLPDGIARFERQSGLPPRDIQIANYLKSLKNSFSSANVRQKYADEAGNVPSQKDLELALTSDLVKLETVIPSELNSINKTLFEKQTKDLVAEMFSGVSSAIKEGDINALESMKVTMGVNDKDELIEKMDKWIKKLSSNPSQSEIMEGIRLLGYEDMLQFSNMFVVSFLKSLQQGISEEQYAYLANLFGGEDKIVEGIEAQRQKFMSLQETYQQIKDKWNVPSARTLILNQLEKQNNVLSRKKLDILKNRFAAIEAGTIQNEKIENSKKRAEANNQLYKFTQDDMEIFAAIEKNMSSMKKYAKMQYQNLNKVMHDALEDQYSNIGMLNGQFWVREEGSSGLSANEQIRIIEQMTGKPYHMETDPIEAAKQIKKGEGSGVSSMSVLDDDYGFHAQYVPAVTSEKFINPLTKEEIVQDIMWTDNSWGKSEKDHYWNGRNGHNYTDYNGGYGWKDGFILSDDFKIGLPVKSLFGAVGSAEGEKFGLFTDVVLPGRPVDAYQKLYKMFAHIFNISEGSESFAQLESALANGYDLNIKELEALDDIAEAKTNRVKKKIEKINTEEEFNKLPDSDEAKLAFEKLAVYLSTDNPLLADGVLLASSKEELEEISKDIFEEHVYALESSLAREDYVMEHIKPYTAEAFSKLFKTLNEKFNLNLSDIEIQTMNDSLFVAPNEDSNLNGSLQDIEGYLLEQVDKVAQASIKDENAAQFFIEGAKNIISETIENEFKVKTLDSPILKNSPVAEKLIAAIDKYLNPASDEELLSFIQGMQMAGSDVVEQFFNALTPEDVGIKERKAYDYVLLYKSGDTSVSKALSEVTATEEIYANLNTSEATEANTPEELYRNLYIKLSDLDVQKFIKSFKAEAFLKYKLRQAFPAPVIITDKAIADMVVSTLEGLKQHYYSIESSKYVLDVLTKYGEIKDGYLSDDVFKSLLNNKNVQVTAENKQFIKDSIQKFIELYKVSSKDESFAPISQPLEKLLSAIKPSDAELDARKISVPLKELIAVFDDFEASGVNKDRFMQLKKEELNALKSNMRIVVNANIEPKYRDEAINRINGIIDLYKKGASDEDIAALSEEFVDFVVEKHIVKNPLALLRETVAMLEDGKKETDEYKVLSSYLNKALEVAQQTKIQYKLVQNQHEAIGSKTKDLLPLFNVTMADGTKEDMNSEVGMLYLIEQLKNAGDNYTILNLFLEQSGLSKSALKAAINNYDVNKTNELITEKSTEIKDAIAHLDELSSVITKFMKMSKIQYKSLEDAMSHFGSYLKRNLKDYENIPVFATYIAALDSLEYQKSIETSNQSMIQPLMNEISREILANIADSINSQLQYISELSSYLQEKAELISSIRVPADSEEYALRESFYSGFEATQALIAQEQQEIIQQINNSSFIGA